MYEREATLLLKNLALLRKGQRINFYKQINTPFDPAFIILCQIALDRQFPNWNGPILRKGNFSTKTIGSKSKAIASTLECVRLLTNLN